MILASMMAIKAPIVKNGDSCGIQNVTKDSITQPAVYALLIVSMGKLILEYLARNRLMAEVLEILSGALLMKMKMLHYATHLARRASMELVLSAGSNAHLACIPVACFAQPALMSAPMRSRT